MSKADEKTLFDEWRSFETDIIPKGAPAVQREECRRAFYAGAVCMFGLMLAATVPEDEDECELRIQRIHDELNAYPQDLRVK
jgi:hypothetical protein